jgi:hypothetical protein
MVGFLGTRTPRAHRRLRSDAVLSSRARIRDNLGGTDWNGIPDKAKAGDWRNFQHTFKPWAGELYHMIDAWGWRPPELDLAGDGANAVNDRTYTLFAPLHPVCEL